MVKIFELTEKEFLTGIAPSSQLQNKGLWFSAKGFPFTSDIFIGGQDTGILQAGPAPTDLTGSVVVDVPFAWATDVAGSATHDLYLWGNLGHLYRLNLASDSTPVDVATGAAVSNPANGIALFKPKGGTRYLYYWQKTQIGRWDPTAAWSTRTNNWATGLTDTDRHPTHRFQDRVYYGNFDKIGYLGDDGAADVEHVADALDVDSDERTDCISDDGVYLVAGLSKSQYADGNVRGQARIIFWDTNQSSWQREWPIPDGAIFAIKRVGTYMEAITSKGIFRFTFDEPPTPVLPYLSGDSAPNAGATYPSQFIADALPAATLFGGQGCVSSIGKLTPEMPTGLLQPLAGFSGDITLVCASARTNNVFVGTSNSKLYRVKFDDTPATGLTAKTIFIDLFRWWQVGRIDIEFDRQLRTGDSLTVSVATEASLSPVTYGAVTFSALGAVRTKELFKTIEARKLQLQFAFNGANPRIRRIVVYGDPLETPTHTRQ